MNEILRERVFVRVYIFALFVCVCEFIYCFNFYSFV